ncbi:hypothetical protein Moror_568 [Moniliophthora roreri MCA 2997]|uniref:P-loop containing nucleoside triphosphate hydrolase protein n=1 Tax=Moniliophthora roreri (strain MCA 2997) TaxID=1381753 RepID=V2WX34_MONRO|nr:hypothetical protein Moror_568 [Moniliophthora roreri MCA 2997]
MASQVVMALNIQTENERIWISGLILPFYASILSALALAVHFAVANFLKTKQNREDEEDAQVVSHGATNGPLAGIREHIVVHGGAIIFSFNIARLGCAAALLGLSLNSLIVDGSRAKAHDGFDFLRNGGQSFRWQELGMCFVFLYGTALALASVIVKPEWSRIFIRHLNAVLLVSFAVYAYQDLYPLGTFNKVPLDIGDRLIWFKITLLAVVSIIIPLLIPRQYIPVDPKNPAAVPNPEQTASLLSLVLYFFMDSVILKGRRGEHLPYDELPPLADYDYAENLRKHAFPYLDPTIQTKRKHVAVSLIQVYRWDYVVLTLTMIIEAVVKFSTPVGVNKLLEYMQTGGEDQTIRPWVWIAFLFIGPTIGSIAYEWYIFVNTRVLVCTESILTQAVFEHALRIRLKANTESHKGGSDESDALSSSSDMSTLASANQQAPSESSAADVAPSQEEGTSTKSSSQPSEEPNKKTSSSRAKPSETNTNQNMIGKLNNLVSTDLQAIVDARDVIRLLVYTPTQLGLCVTFLYLVLGWSAFVGLAVIIMMFPIPGALTKWIGRAQANRMKQTDARVQAISEIMGVLRMVKMFGWERKMYDRITEKRERELVYIWKMRMLGISTTIANYAIPIVTMLVTYATYVSKTFTLIMKEQLSASKVFSSMVVFDQFESQLRMLMLMLNQTVTAKVSLDRMTDFLYGTELLDAYSKPANDVLLQQPDNDENPDIGFRNASFSWSSSPGSETPNSRRFILRIEDELLFKKGVINLIIGPTGSGKTSLLMALLSEMHFIPTSLDSWYNLPRAGGVAYAAQESWVQNATIKDNIVFGSPFDEARYKKVLHQCCLERDLTLFAAGDETEVGEKGLTLSGGQKARVTLARAVYSQAGILLLDDVLAALDVHTSKWIVEKCFKGDLLKGRTVILVTHNVVMLQALAGNVISVKDGKIVSQGTVNEALGKDEILAAEVEKEKEAEEQAEEVVDPVVAETRKEGKLILPEEVDIGRLGWPALKLWLTSLGGQHYVLFFLLFVGLYLAADAAEASQTWYLGYWAQQYNEHPPEEVNALHYISFYALILLVVIMGNIAGLVYYMYGTLRASRLIHQQLIQAILGTTMRWLDQTPTSRVITRVTQDIRDIDDPVSQAFATLIGFSTILIVKFLAVVIFTPAFLGPAILVAIMGGWCGQIYIRSSMPVKRETSNAKAPVLGHFGAAMQGLVSIRAYGVQEAFRQESQAHINQYVRPARTFYNLNRWIDIRVDAIANTFTTALAAYLIYLGHHNPSNTGYSLNMAVGFSGRVLLWIRFMNMFEIRGNSLERINHYINIEQEPKGTPQGKPPASWPCSGDIRVEALSAKYSPEGPKVLKNLTFNVKSGEHIGVVGRTGSGKSSLMLSLLRCIQTEGSVYYDGLLTSNMNLEDLRSNITIIPQMPELLTGSVRENLDPFSQHNDAALNGALRTAGLFSLQEENNEDYITLDSSISSGGSNLSVGQRQILALARAMVRGSKLFILDEATSAIDYKTDAVIQRSLRQELGKDVTLITVAHRLQTIMDADRIMVLDAGSIVEFDSPRELLKLQNGKLRALVDESADKQHLYAMAQSLG